MGVAVILPEMIGIGTLFADSYAAESTGRLTGGLGKIAPASG